ncbi:DUF3038 domain-containing protein [Cyanothece sp. BG0011]|uniref:DUF3038 domain-containing protein n=1 Tax=Cyanothece sp. BG0011 TaxID=2082950 RepID=UPI000D1E80C7|nr:DUF3038 domain-containing protein [Cyanothece sp. BG0011]
MSQSVPTWGDTPLTNPPTPQQLYQMQTHLDLVLLASECLISIDADMLLQAALDLDVNTTLVENVALWSNRDTTTPDNPLNSLTIEQMRSLILIICYINQQHQELIRRAVTLLEQLTAQNKDPAKTTLLGNYLENFQRFYSKEANHPNLSPSQQMQLASKLLIDLLFYSEESSYDRLWLALLDYQS